MKGLSEGVRHAPSWLALVAMAALLGVTVGPRLAYPFDLEWMEGGMLLHALRVRQGLPIYTEPGPDWIPYVYPPLYPWLVAGLGEPSYAAARALSLASAVFAAGLAALAVRLEGAPWGSAGACGALVISCYDDVGTFFDLARNDTLALALAAAALVVTRRGSVPAAVVGGLLLAAAFLTKHSYALLGLPTLVWLLAFRGRREALAYVLASAGVAGMAVAALQLTTGGWFLVWLIEVPAAHGWVGSRAWPGAELELLAAFPVTLALAVGVAAWHTPGTARTVAAWAVAGLVVGAWLSSRWLMDQALALDGAAEALVGPGAPDSLWALPLALVALVAMGAAFVRRVRDEGAWYWLGQGVVLVGLAVSLRSHQGGFLNVLLPGLWGLAVVASAGVGRSAVAWLLGLAVVVDVARGAWDPATLQPTPEDVVAGEQVVEVLRHVEGPVLSPHAPWLAVQAGKEPAFALIALWDIDHPEGPAVAGAEAVERAFSERRWAAVLVGGRGLRRGFGDHYRLDRRLPVPPGTLATLTGWPVRPVELWVPRRSGAVLPP